MSAAAKWETLANEAIEDAGEWKQRSRAAEAQRDELLAALREVERWDSVSRDDAEWPSVMECVSAAIARAEDK